MKLDIQRLENDIRSNINSKTPPRFKPNHTLYKDLKSSRSARKWGFEKYKQVKNDFSMQDKALLSAYQSGMCDVNFFERGLIKEYHKFDEINIRFLNRRAEMLSNILKKSQIPEDIVVYRGASNDIIGKYCGDTRNLIGKIIKENGFMSTSLIKNITSDFSLDKNSVVLKINVPKGANGLYLPAITSHPLNFQQEVLFDKGQILVISDAQKTKSGKFELTCDLII